MTNQLQAIPTAHVGDSAPVWWHAPTRFLVHALVGTFIFLLIACTALGLAFFVKWLEEKSLEVIIIWGLKLGEYSLFLADLFLFLVFLLRAAKRTFKEL